MKDRLHLAAEAYRVAGEHQHAVYDKWDERGVLARPRSVACDRETTHAERLREYASEVLLCVADPARRWPAWMENDDIIGLAFLKSKRDRRVQKVLTIIETLRRERELEKEK